MLQEHGPESQCTFWCSVLSDTHVAAGVRGLPSLNAPSGAQCFPTRRHRSRRHCGDESQCTFWCSVLSDRRCRSLSSIPSKVSMHLLVLSAFRPSMSGMAASLKSWLGLNAPSGAQCFPTPPPENRATTPFTETKSPPTWKAPHRIGPHLSN